MRKKINGVAVVADGFSFLWLANSTKEDVNYLIFSAIAVLFDVAITILLC